MAMTESQKTDAYQFFIIAFNAVPGVEYMNQLNDAYEAGMTTQDIVNVYTTKPQFEAIYPRFYSDEQFANKLIETVVGASASAEARAEAKADVMAALGTGWTKGDVIYQIFSNLAAKDSSDPDWGNTASMLANKVQVAAWATETALLNSEDLAELGAPLLGVTADPASVDAAINGSSGSGAAKIRLTAGQDTVLGTGADDVFTANVVQNANGAQVNSLGSGDYVDGGAGNDVLNAKITSGVFAGGSTSMPIQPELNSVETVNLQAVIADINGVANNDVVYFNAKDVVGTQKIASNHSDASLVIQNMTSQGLNHVSQMTVGMEYTGNADHMWKESDLSVYFDQDYLTTQRLVGRPSVDIQVMNEDGYDQTDGAEPLAGVFFRELTFTLNGVRYDLTDYLNEDPSGAGTEITTYDEALGAINDALAALKADNPSNAALQTVQAELGPKFHADRNPDTLVLREGTSIRLSVEGLTNGVDNALSITQTDLELARAAGAAVENNNRFERADNEPPTEDSNLSINIDLEKVGLTGDGGTLIVGSMNKTAANEWGAGHTVTNTVSGFQEFDVHVHGTNDKSSSLAGLHSTNNNLRTVVIDSHGGSDGKAGWADLYIGNSNTAGLSGEWVAEPGYWVKDDIFSTNEETWSWVEPEIEHWSLAIGSIPSSLNANALKDVQTLDASAFKGDLHVYAALTDEVGAKYLNRGDAAPAHSSADNVAFAYTGGVGDDYFNVAVSAANLEGTGPATREDWNLKLDGGAGNDELVVGLVGGEDFFEYYDSDLAWAGDSSNWYHNQEMLGRWMTNLTGDHWWAGGNITVNGGTGDDVVRTMGSGDYTINGGTGNDAIYVDNTGGRSVWALNYDHGDLDSLASDTNETYLVWNTKIRVSFHGFESTVDLSAINGRADDLAINQAVKAAINNDAVLSKLLVAQDGPANSLIVKALVDGRYDSDGFLHEDLHGLSVSMIVPTASELSAGDVNAIEAAWGPAYNTDTAIAAKLASTASDFGDHSSGGTYQIGTLDNGWWSYHTQDSIITGGLGNDVIVLGTGEDSNDTVVYSGFDNGTDSIVHFETGNDVQVVETTVVHGEGRAEKVVVTFNDLTATASNATVVFDGTTVQLNNAAGGLIPGKDLALAFSEQYAGANWTSSYTVGSNQVTLTHNTIGEFAPNLNAGDFATANLTGTIGVATTVEGIDPYTAAFAGTKETFTVQFNAAGGLPETAVTSAHDITFDGVTNVHLAVGDGAQTVAAKVKAGNYANWTTELGSDGTSVTFTAKTVGDKTDATAGDFDDTHDGIHATVSVVDGLDPTAQIGAQWTEIIYDTIDAYSARDYLDFSAYGAVNVQIDQVSAADQLYGLVSAAGDKYITMVESTTNAGEYTTALWQDNGAAADTQLGTIGVLDFGDTMDFQAYNFILGGSIAAT